MAGEPARLGRLELEEGIMLIGAKAEEASAGVGAEVGGGVVVGGWSGRRAVGEGGRVGRHLARRRREGGVARPGGEVAFQDHGAPVLSVADPAAPPATDRVPAIYLKVW